MALAEGEGESGIELGGVEGVVDVVEFAFGFWL